MSRLSYAKRHPRRALAALASVLAATGVAIGSGADFSAHTANPTNTFSAGNMHLTNSPSGALFTVSGLKPGDQSDGTVDITNDGSVDASSFTLSRTNLVDKDASSATCNTSTNICSALLSDKLNLRVYDCGDFTTTAPTCPSDATIAAATGDPNVKFDGTLSGFTSAASLGALAANHSHRYRFLATFDPSATSAYQSESSQADFEWNAAQ
jgi:hypothetical protein